MKNCRSLGVMLMCAARVCASCWTLVLGLCFTRISSWLSSARGPSVGALELVILTTWAGCCLLSLIASAV
eukprot:6463789-Amphidinium_carterae.3